jgi:hypothetical protein
MHIYFCGAIAGGRDDLAVYQHIVGYPQSEGHTVPTRHVANPDVLEEERVFGARAIYERDVTWMPESDAMIAEISAPSLGVGYVRGVRSGKFTFWGAQLLSLSTVSPKK